MTKNEQPLAHHCTEAAFTPALRYRIGTRIERHGEYGIPCLFEWPSLQDVDWTRNNASEKGLLGSHPARSDIITSPCHGRNSAKHFVNQEFQLKCMLLMIDEGTQGS